MKMITLTLILTLFTATLKAPNQRVIYIDQPEGINPFENVWKAVCQVESSGDPFAIGDKHLKEWSYGISQIRQVRLDHYYDRTGIRYYEKDMFSPAKSKQVFMYFADQIGPYNLEKVIRNWNGSGKKTYKYLAKVKNQMR